MNSEGAASESGGVETPLEAAMRVYQECERAEAALAAKKAVALASFPELATPDGVRGTDADMHIRSSLAELGIMINQSDRALWHRMDAAYVLVKFFPATHQALADGTISMAHAREIQHAGTGLEADARAVFETRALERAVQETPGRLKSWLASLAEPLQIRSINQRHQEARALRGVSVTDLGDGMSEFRATLPATLAHGILDRLTQMARTVKRRQNPGDELAGQCGDGARRGDVDAFGIANPLDTRTIDQIRADVLCDLALSGRTCAHGDGLDAIQAHVQVVVPVLNLVGSTDAGADLIGTGPIDATTARRLAGAASGWDRVMTHPISGQVLATDRYQPTAELKRMLRVRDEHCRFPGCLQKPWQSDIDHSTAWADGGTTTSDNLAHLCRRHHTLKHARGWLITHLGGGRIQWTSPHGLIYIDSPPPKLRFAPSSPDTVLDGSDAPF